MGLHAASELPETYVNSHAMPWGPPSKELLMILHTIRFPVFRSVTFQDPAETYRT